MRLDSALRRLFFKSLRASSLNYFSYSHKNGFLYILVFHRVNDDNSSFYPAVPTSAFEGICRFLSKKFKVISISEIDEYFEKTRSPAAIFSFDDNYYDILENAYPILKKYGLKFNVNIITECLESGLPQDGGKVYDVLNTTEKREYVNTEILSEPIRINIDKTSPSKTELAFSKLFRRLNKKERRLIADDVVKKLANSSTKFSRMLSKEDVVYLKKEGAEIGSHTHSHPILINSDISEIEFELVHSKKILEDLCGGEINIIAFPQGMHNKTVVQKSFELGYKYLLLTENKENIVDNPGNTMFYRIGLYHNTADENLAKIFGFHEAVHSLIGKFRP